MENKVLKRNILIAEFWGYKYEKGVAWYNPFGLKEHYWIKNKNNSIQRLDSKNFRFNFDWNWVIPVVYKITSMDTNTAVLRDAQNKFINDVKKEIIWNEIDKVNKCIVKFINVYNENI
jgi:hypothetical protein